MNDFLLCFATNDRGRDITGSSKSMNRCLLLLAYMRFDVKTSKEERSKEDVSEIFNFFVKECQENFR